MQSPRYPRLWLMLSLLLTACGGGDDSDDLSPNQRDYRDTAVEPSTNTTDSTAINTTLANVDWRAVDKQTPAGEHIVKVLYAQGTKRVYLLKNGTKETRTGGTRAWRNNNEGNLEFGKFAKAHYALGSDSRFAIFPSEYLGIKAKERLLFFTGSYKNLSLFKAIHRYAPSVENNTDWYYRTVKSAVGVDKPMAQYNEQQRGAIIHAMRKVEGWRKGKIYRQAMTATANACYARGLC